MRYEPSSQFPHLQNLNCYRFNPTSLTYLQWFTERFIATVGDEFIPGANLDVLDDEAALIGKKGRDRRKIYTLSSMKEVVITLSTVDIVTDAYMVVLYYSRGLDIQGNIMVAMLSVNMTIQLFAVIVVYKKKGWRRLLREILLTVCYLRPFVDAHRVNNRETSREGGESEGGQR